MYTIIPEVLDSSTLAKIRGKLQSASWNDGAITAGSQAIHVKSNLQLSSQDPTRLVLAELIKTAVQQSGLFVSVCLPRQLLTPFFNRYTPEHPSYDWHVDNAIRYEENHHAIRCDLSCTVFLSHPEDYVGGELEIQDQDAIHRVKLKAGDAIIYPSHTLHRVCPVLEGERLASFFWIESFINDLTQRQTLHQLDQCIATLREQAENEQTRHLTNIYHRLLQMWS